MQIEEGGVSPRLGRQNAPELVLLLYIIACISSDIAPYMYVNILASAFLVGVFQSDVCGGNRIVQSTVYSRNTCSPH